MTVCPNCGQKARQTAPCPCGLGTQCPYHGGFGVCDRCYQTIVANANDRRNEFTAFPSSYPQDVDGKVVV